MSEDHLLQYHVRQREFLNDDPELPAFIIGVVEDTRWIPDDDSEQRWNWGTVILDLGDCYRRVSFDFCMETQADRESSLRKIDKIAEVVHAVQFAIAIEVESRNARPIKKEKEERDKEAVA